MKYKLLHLIPIFILSACAAPKKIYAPFQPVTVPADSAILYVYNPHAEENQYALKFFINGKEQFDLHDNGYGYVNLEEGDHKLKFHVVGSGAPPVEAVISVLAGEEYYVRAEPTTPDFSGVSGSIFDLILVSSALSNIAIDIRIVDKQSELWDIKRSSLVSELIADTSSELAANAAPFAGDFSGTYLISRISASRFGTKYLPFRSGDTVILAQRGNSISGRVQTTGGKTGSVSGSVSGREISFWWRSPTGSGTGKWRLDDDEAGLVGTYDRSASIHGPWNLTLVKRAGAESEMGSAGATSASRPSIPPGQLTDGDHVVRLVTPAPSADGSSSETRVDLQALVPGATRTGVGSKGVRFLVYTAPDGRVFARFTTPKKKVIDITGSWEINHQNQLCEKWDETTESYCLTVTPLDGNKYITQATTSDDRIEVVFFQGDTQGLDTRN